MCYISLRHHLKKVFKFNFYSHYNAAVRVYTNNFKKYLKLEFVILQCILVDMMCELVSFIRSFLMDNISMNLANKKLF